MGGIILSEKRICIISANCQGAYIKTLLNKHEEFSKDFQVLYFVNYNKEIVPKELLNKADILIYQPLSSKWGELSEKYLLEHAIKNPIKIRISYLTFPIYWPFFTHDPRNVNNKNYPFGQFPYGDRFILDLLRKGLEKEKVFEIIKTRQILDKVDLKKVIENYVNFQKDLESRRDQKLLDFIIENYKKYKLFESYNHPSKVLAVYQVNDILRMLGYRSLKNEEIPSLRSLTLFQQPIHPYIAEALNLEFEADWETEYIIWNKPMKAIDYYKAYIWWDTTSIGIPREENVSNNAESCGTCHISVINTKVSKIKDIKVYKENVIGKQVVFIHIPKTGGLSVHKMLSLAMFDVDKYKRFNSLKELVADTNRRLYPLVSGHFFFDAYKILSKEVIIFTFLRDPIKRVISAFEFMKSHPEVWLGELAQGSLRDFLSHPYVQKSINNVQTKLLGFEINFGKYYSQLINKEINQEEYYRIFETFITMEVTEKDLERAKYNLEKLFFVGFTETLSQDVEYLFSKLGLECPNIVYENRTPEHVRNRERYTKDEIALIEELNKYDIELYNYAWTKFKKS